MLLFAMVFIGPTGAKDNFMKKVMNPRAEKMHKDLSEAMKLESTASDALKKAILVITTQDGIAMIFIFSVGAASIGLSLIALSLGLRAVSKVNRPSN